VQTLAGSGEDGFADGPASAARFSQPTGIAVDLEGKVYVADTGNNRIRVISGGQVTTLAGTSPPGTSPPESSDVKMAPLPPSSHGDRKPPESPSHRPPEPPPFADGPAATALFAGPWGIAVDSAGTVFIADRGNERIRTISRGMVSTVAGSWPGGYVDGPAETAKFSSPSGVAMDDQGRIYITETGNRRLRMISKGEVTTIAVMPGDPPMYQFSGVAVGNDGRVFVTGAEPYTVAVLRNGELVVLAGSDCGYVDGPAQLAKFGNPAGIAVTDTGLLVVEVGFNRIREIVF
jgi:DNA-binding beta-propeller fold protein YncE